MKTFYSIIKISPNPITDDLISIGIIMKGSNDFFIKFSNRRKKLANSLLKNNKSVDFLIKQLNSKIEELNNSLVSGTKKLFSEEQHLNPSYLTHLNISHQGILRFSKPTILNLPGSKSDFNNLFATLIDQEGENDKKVKSEFSTIIEKKLIQEVKTTVHTHRKFNRKWNNSLYFNFEMDVIGKNGSLFALKSLDFSSYTIETLEKNSFHYEIIKHKLEDKFPSNNNKYILIADEPNSITSDEHRLWEIIKKQENFEFRNSEEVSEIVTELLDSGVHKFLD